MTTKQMQDWDDGTVGFQSQRSIGTGELRDTILVHPRRPDVTNGDKLHPGGVVVEFATEIHYGGGATQRSESSITLDPDQAATFARAMSAPRLGGIAGAGEILQKLDCDEFELLTRRFTMAPAGIDRAHAKQALLLFVAKQIGGVK